MDTFAFSWKYEDYVYTNVFNIYKDNFCLNIDMNAVTLKKIHLKIMESVLNFNHFQLSAELLLFF